MPQLEAIAQSLHVGVRILHQLESIGNDPDGPGVDRGLGAGFEAEVEVAGVAGVDAEGVDRSLGIGFRVGGQPFL